MSERLSNGMPYRGPYAVLDTAEVSAVLTELAERPAATGPLASAIEKLKAAAEYDSVFRGPMK